MERLRKAAYWVLPSLFCLILYWPGLLAWFQQDDFVWLRLRSEVYNWRDLWNAIFTPNVHGTFRPLSERAFFLLFSSLFHTEALPFRVWVFLTQFANLALLSSIVRRMSVSPMAGFWAPIFWTANAGLATVMAWTSGYMQILCGFCLLTAFHFLLRYLQTGQPRYYYLQWIPFVLGFGVLETTIVYPVLAASYTLLCARKRFRSTLTLFVPSILYGIFDLVVAPKQVKGLYAMHFDAAIPGTFLTYWQWALEPRKLPELTGLPRWAGPAGLALFTVALVGFMVWAAWRKQWLPLAFGAWFVIILGPMLPLRDHVSYYYLTLPVMGLGMLAAYALASAWRGPAAWKAIGILLTGAFLLIQAPTARGHVKWWSGRSRAVKRMVQGLVEARQLHPGKTIVLTGVNDDLFWGGILDGAFQLVGLSGVYLAPGSESAIQPHPELGRVSDFVLPVELVARGLAQEQLVVYACGGPRLRNITRTYAASMRFPPSSQGPRRVDVSDPLTASLLGPAWYQTEGRHRWMPQRATLRIGGPRSPAEKLHLTGYCVVAQTESGPLDMSLSVEGEPVGAVRILRCDRPFTFDFGLPGEVVGKPSIEIGIQVSRTFTPAGEDRALGLAFGVFEIR